MSDANSTLRPGTACYLRGLPGTLAGWNGRPVTVVAVAGMCSCCGAPMYQVAAAWLPVDGMILDRVFLIPIAGPGVVETTVVAEPVAA